MLLQEVGTFLVTLEELVPRQEVEGVEELREAVEVVGHRGAVEVVVRWLHSLD
jgi:hypothetical protein